MSRYSNAITSGMRGARRGDRGTALGGGDDDLMRGRSWIPRMSEGEKKDLIDTLKKMREKGVAKRAAKKAEKAEEAEKAEAVRGKLDELGGRSSASVRGKLDELGERDSRSSVSIFGEVEKKKMPSDPTASSRAEDITEKTQDQIHGRTVSEEGPTILSQNYADRRVKEAQMIRDIESAPSRPNFKDGGKIPLTKKKKKTVKYRK